MKQKLKQTQTYTTTLQLSQTMKNSLHVLKMNQNDVVDFIHDLVDKNPLIEYIPSADMNQFIQESFAQEKSLKDELYLQLNTTLKPYQKDVASYLIESLDEHGFLSESCEEYAKLLHVSKDVIVKNLDVIQSFEPMGVAAKNSLDSIQIQLARKNHFKALHILNTYQEELLHQDLNAISKKEGLSKDEVLELISYIQECTPYPCAGYRVDQTKTIIPDFSIHVEEDEIFITPKDIGHLQIYNDYSKKELQDPRLIRYFNEAHFFIDHLNKRNKTLLILANILVDIQKSHFLYQDELEPCTLLMIAERSGFHVSTVSRTLSNKYFEFNNELYPVKSLFVSSTKDGTSKDLLLKSIQSLINQEDPNDPLKDEQIVEQLELYDLNISRRAVSKYRSILNIPNSKQRKKQYKKAQ